MNTLTEDEIRVVARAIVRLAPLDSDSMNSLLMKSGGVRLEGKMSTVILGEKLEWLAREKINGI
jgi:hypothetical protein